MKHLIKIRILYIILFITFFSSYVNAQTENSLFRFSISKAFALSQTITYSSNMASEYQERFILSQTSLGYYFTENFSSFIDIPLSLNNFAIKNNNAENQFLNQSFFILKNIDFYFQYLRNYDRYDIKWLGGLELPTISKILTSSQVTEQSSINYNYESFYSDESIEKNRILSALAGISINWTFDPILLFFKSIFCYPLWRNIEPLEIYETFNISLQGSIYFIINDKVTIFGDLAFILQKQVNPSIFVESYICNGGVNILISPISAIGIAMVNSFNGTTYYPGITLSFTQILKSSRETR